MVELCNGYIISADRYNFALYKKNSKGVLLIQGYYQTIDELLRHMLTKEMREKIGDTSKVETMEMLLERVQDLYSYVNGVAAQLKNVTIKDIQTVKAKPKQQTKDAIDSDAVK